MQLSELSPDFQNRDLLCFLAFPLRLQEAKSQLIPMASWKTDIENRT